MRNDHFLPWGGIGKPMRDPVTKFDFERNLLLWDITLALQFSYTPYLVQFSNVAWSADDVTVTQFDYKFIDCWSPSLQLVGSLHTQKVPDWGLLHHDIPSTLPTKAQMNAGQNIGFVFLNVEAMPATVKNDSALANITPPDTGKFPRGTSADASTPVTLQAEHASLIRRLLEEGDNLTSVQRVRLLAALVGG